MSFCVASLLLLHPQLQLLFTKVFPANAFADELFAWQLQLLTTAWFPFNVTSPLLAFALADAPLFPQLQLLIAIGDVVESTSVSVLFLPP